MLRDYADIIEKLGPPQWWDDNGCPRYRAFHPDACGVYDDAVALLEIACQACGVRFLVASEWTQLEAVRTAMLRREHPIAMPAPTLPVPSAGTLGDFGWGDPPPHDGCASGPTMSCDPVAVVECWVRTRSGVWSRHLNHEGTLALETPDART